MKILIIEDEKLLADSLKAFLQSKGFEVEAVYDGEAGEEYAERGMDTLFISDQVEIHMSDMDTWLSGAEGLASVLADDYDLSLYYDRSAASGGQVRLISASKDNE